MNNKEYTLTQKKNHIKFCTIPFTKSLNIKLRDPTSENNFPKKTILFNLQFGKL